MQVPPGPSLISVAQSLRHPGRGPLLYRGREIGKCKKMFRIATHIEGDALVVRLAGRLSGAGLGELEQVRREASLPVVLDLAELLSADDAGVATLRNLRRLGVVLRHPSPYMAMLIEEEDLR